MSLTTVELLQMARGKPRLQGAARRWATRNDPQLFALWYLSHHLKSKETGNQVSYSQFHMDLIESAKEWMRDDLGPQEIREAWISPRESGKSTWLFCILPIWALAHGHRRFISAYAGKAELAQQHLTTFKSELDNNALLREDYPDLCRAARRPSGLSVADHQALYLAKSGVVFQARGIDTMNLGTKVGTLRPDLLLLDDVERDEGNYSIHQKEQRLKTILQAIFPMNINAVVQITGTTTMYGSIMHDLVRSHTDTEAPQWVEDEHIRTRYYPAIYPRSDGSEDSMWPQRWSLEWLQGERHKRSFALNYMNLPMSAEGGFWSPEDFLHPAPSNVTRRIISIDPAVTTKTTSDYTGIAVVGYDPTAEKCVVELVEQVKLPPAQLRARILKILEVDPSIKAVIIEANQGGDTWAEVLNPLPVRVMAYNATEPKDVRAARALDWYQNGWVAHPRPLPQFEAQALAFPNAANDDMVDAVCAGLKVFLGKKKRPTGKTTSAEYA